MAKFMVIRSSDIAKCPAHRFDVPHYMGPWQLRLEEAGKGICACRADQPEQPRPEKWPRGWHRCPTCGGKVTH